MLTKLNKNNLFLSIIMLLFMGPTVLGTSTYAATDFQKEDAIKRSPNYDGESVPCDTSASGAEISAGDSGGSGGRIGYVSGLAGPYILEQFMIHSLKALAVAKGVPETDVLTEEHVIALVAFAIGEGGDINNRNIFNPLNHGKIGNDNGTLTGDGTSGFVKYSNFDDGVDSNARVLNGTYQQRVAAALINKDTTAEQFMDALSYYQDYKNRGFSNDDAWAEDSSPGTKGAQSADAYYQGRLSLIDQVKADWNNTAGLVIGTEVEEQGAGTVQPSKLTYHPAGSSAGGTDSEIPAGGGVNTDGSADACTGAGGPGGTATILGEKAFPLAISNKSQLENANLFYDNTYERGTHGTYEAIDLMVNAGTPVKAFISGKVKRISTDRCGGVLVTVLSENQGEDSNEIIMVSYMHMGSTNVQEGSSLNKGDSIGLSGDGSVGCDTPHLHIDAIKGDVKLACSRNGCPAEEAAKYIDLGPELFKLFNVIPD